MIKTLISQVGEYKKVSLLTPLFTALEVLMEILIPFITASIIDKGIEAGDMRQVCLYGAIMLILAFLSLTFGVLAGRYAAAASAGFACNLREGMYKNIQTFSFSNIDKFSTAGLVTRMTTDVTNLQMAYQMCLRIAVRSPLMLVCSMAMCFFINVRLSAIFLVAMVVLGCGLFFIMSRTTRVFREVFRKYDELNASVQENVTAIRVVKAFVREIYENEKFRKAAEILAIRERKGECDEKRCIKTNIRIHAEILQRLLPGCDRMRAGIGPVHAAGDFVHAESDRRLYFADDGGGCSGFQRPGCGADKTGGGLCYRNYMRVWI